MANNIQRLYSMQRLYSGSRDIRHDGTFDSSASDDDQDEQPGDDQDEQPEDDQDEQPDDEQPDDDQDEQSERSSPTMIEIENARQEELRMMSPCRMMFELKMRRKLDDVFMQERRETHRMSQEDPLPTQYMRWSRSHRGWVDELLTETDEEPQPDKKPELDNKSDAQPEEQPELDNKSDAQPEEQPELDTKSDAKPEEQPEPDTTSDAKPEETPDQPEPARKILRLGVRAHG